MAPSKEAGETLTGERLDDPDESTVLDVQEPDDEPTTIRPTPTPQDVVRDITVTRGAGRSTTGRKVGKYELRDRLARGAFGVVFTARDPSLDRDVAIKILRPTHLGNAAIVQRFLQEARATARIAHPGIVTIHDCGQVQTNLGETAFIAMELLSGESLTARLESCGRLQPDAAVEIARQIASALEAAHRVDVLHRDLKPDNIYLVPDPAMPSGERVKVFDFGLAKLGHSGHTQLQTVFGTPRYMSPEQCRSSAQVDHRSDIYALGCILFELVTGQLPFDGEVRQLIERHQRVLPPRASVIAPDVPDALDDLISEMLSKDPLDRPQTMGAVQRALRRIANPRLSTGDLAPMPTGDPMAVNTPQTPIAGELIAHIPGSAPNPMPGSAPNPMPGSAPHPMPGSAPHPMPGAPSVLHAGQHHAAPNMPMPHMPAMAHSVPTMMPAMQHPQHNGQHPHNMPTMAPGMQHMQHNMHAMPPGMQHPQHNGQHLPHNMPTMGMQPMPPGMAPSMPAAAYPIAPLDPAASGEIIVPASPGGRAAREPRDDSRKARKGGKGQKARSDDNRDDGEQRARMPTAARGGLKFYGLIAAGLVIFSVLIALLAR